MSDTQSEFQNFLSQQDQGEYLTIHTKRYIETYSRIEQTIADGSSVVELGSESVISSFLRSRRGCMVETISSDLRFPYAFPGDAVDVVLSLEVVEHLNDSHNMGSSIEEIAMFSMTGAKCMFGEAFRILKTGGKLIMTTPNANSLDVIGNVINNRHPFQYPPHVREYTIADILQLGAAAGFACDYVSTFFAWNSMPDVSRAHIMKIIQEAGADTANRGDDSLFIFAKQ
jgi:SAM-dependent methyltransferase